MQKQELRMQTRKKERRRRIRDELNEGLKEGGGNYDGGAECRKEEPTMMNTGRDLHSMQG